MRPTSPHEHGDNRTAPLHDTVTLFTPPISTRDIFEQLIADELRAGRLTASRRKRIVGYATGMGLSAVQAGRLITACRDEALAGDDEVARHHALRLVDPPADGLSKRARLSWFLAAVIALDLVVVFLLG